VILNVNGIVKQMNVLLKQKKHLQNQNLKMIEKKEKKKEKID